MHSQNYLCNNYFVVKYYNFALFLEHFVSLNPKTCSSNGTGALRVNMYWNNGQPQTTRTFGVHIDHKKYAATMTMLYNSDMPTIMWFLVKGCLIKTVMFICSGDGGCTLNLLSESVWCRSGIIGQGRQGDPMEAYSVLTASAAHTNWTPLLGLTVMKLLLS